ncbi:hypothetical protein [Catelliglobosispora koreensis]|uniref:hypothetical protein n=1 Tax=Catelliglobosispora koreensis TaxID=129052 RepID=UPI000366BE76|nr:hypothetical protein [Catelliglobosispora koreensis]
MRPADEIKQAAQHLRDVAGKAMPGPWHQETPGSHIIHGHDGTVAETIYEAADATHIALLDPPSALLLADLLDGMNLFWRTAKADEVAVFQKSPLAAFVRAINAKAGQR